MSYITTISPDRLAWCCHQFGISTDELAAEVRLSPDRFTEEALQQKGLTFTQLSTVAKFFGRGVLFFTEQSDEAPAPQVDHVAQFRTFQNHKPELSLRLKQLVDRVARQRQIYLNLIDDLDDDRPTMFDPVGLPDGDIRTAAAWVRQWLRLEERNDFDSYRQAVERRGILVFGPHGYKGPWQLAKESPVAGFSLYDSRCPVIVVKKTQSESRRCFTLMHELAHVLLHRSSWIDEPSDLNAHDVAQERQANQLAGLVLVPPEFLQNIDLGRLPDDVHQFDTYFQPYTQRWRVSTEVILRRLMDEGRLSPVTYQAYRNKVADLGQEDQQGGSRTYRHREPRHLFGDRYVRAVLDSLSAQTITLTKASAYLDGIDVKDVHKLEQFCARPHP